MPDNEEFIAEFLIEAGENLDQLDQDLIGLEADPQNPERLASIFRTVHTIKGTCGFFGFTKLSGLTHHGEHLLGRLRDGELVFNDALASLLLKLVDAIREILSAIEVTGNEGDAVFTELSLELEVAAASTSSSSKDSGKSDRPTIPTESSPDQEVIPAAVLPTASDGDSTEETEAEEIAPTRLAAAESVPATDPSRSTSPTTTKEPALPQPRTPAALDATIRVDVGLLDNIVDLVGELVLARNQLRTAPVTDPVLANAINRIHAVTGELQEVAMQTRMAPIDQLFSKFPRIVRDVASSCGKQVDLSVDGSDTELDRSLIEKIRDPLTHLIRNAIDHGIESAEARHAAGKPAAGRLSLRALHESGQVTIEVSDDGGGISVDAIREKAIARGLVSAEAAASMSTDRIYQFIFEPGFSTAQTVTNISGRGVGMDVVRTNIESIGGTVDITSQPGVGTIVRVRIPLTLAIIPALIVTSGGERLAIPQPYVQELIALRDTGPHSTIEGLDGAPVLRLRDRLIPVVFMDRWLGLRDWSDRPTRGTVVIVRVDNHEFGLVVDAVTTVGQNSLTTAENTGLWIIVVKPISSLLAPMGLYSGATVMGDGGVVLILDLRGLAMATDIPARLNSETLDHSGDLDESDSTPDRAQYLVCETCRGRRIAIPLQHVERLETIASSEIRQAGDRQFINRNQFLTRLINPDQLLDSEPSCVDNVHTPTLVGVIFNAAAGSDALLVQRIIDVNPAESPLTTGIGGQGLLGTLLVGGETTEVIDVPAAAHWAAHATAS